MENIKEYVEEYASVGDKPLTNRYEEIRDYLITRRDASMYAKNHNGAPDTNMTAFQKEKEKENKKFGPAVAFVPIHDTEMTAFAEKMKAAGWVDSIHTNDSSKSLKLTNLPDQKIPERVFILGHGSPETPYIHVGDEHFDGKQIAQMLIDQGLPAKIHQIEILTCFAAKGVKKKLFAARESYVESVGLYNAAKKAYKASDGDKALKKVMVKAEKVQDKADVKYTAAKADPENFYTVKAKKPAEFAAWNLPFVAELTGHLKTCATRKFTNIHVTAYTAPFILYFNKDQTRFFDLTGIKTEGFLSHKRECTDPKIKRACEAKSNGSLYIEPVGPFQLKNREWIDANKDIRKIWM